MTHARRLVELPGVVPRKRASPRRDPRNSRDARRVPPAHRGRSKIAPLGRHGPMIFCP